MPTYTYHCDACDHPFEKILRMSQYADPQDCPECGGAARKTVSPVGFVLKGDGWTGKNLKIKRQMAKKNQRLDAKAADRRRSSSGPKLVPNVGGERTESWSDAGKLAKSKGLGTSGYEKKAASEKSSS